MALDTMTDTSHAAKGAHDLHVILLSGGSGTRLWPLSSEARPKQFVKVLRNDAGEPESMVQRTVRLIRSQVPQASLTIATEGSQVDVISRQINGSFALSVEPERRDTAPAIMLAAAHVAWKQGASPDTTVVVMPIDSYADASYYARIADLDKAVQADCADLVLLGVQPTSPSSKYGYILPEAEVRGTQNGTGVRRVARFCEKPDATRAEELIEAGALWNCGVFAFRLRYVLSLLGAYCDATSYGKLVDAYARLPKNSFDYEVVEKARSVAVMPYVGTWEDLGTWNTLCERLAAPTSGPVWLDPATSGDVHVINETEVPVLVAGLSDVVVVATPNGILVADKRASAHIKGLVGEVLARDDGCTGHDGA